MSTNYSGERIAQIKADGGAALIGYLPVGYPTVRGSIDAVKALIDGGVDVIELGFPYSDPGMDGEVIQRASEAALARGVKLKDYIAAVEELAPLGAPITLMSYYNPIHRYGVEAFARDLANAGAAGVITPDLTPDAGGQWRAAATAAGLEQIFLVAPSSTDERLRMTVEAHRGWIYAASTMGVTGVRAKVDDVARQLVERTRAAGADLVCVGLGVSNGEQAAELAQYSDGVIVGSAFVRTVGEASAADLARLRQLASSIRAGVR